jgi:hypothetical protein
MKKILIGVCVVAAALATIASPKASAKDNYEIQVYGADTVEPGHTMFELHSNFTFQGSKTIMDGLFPTNHAEHETLEITHGFTSWFEVGFYIFTSERSGQGIDWVGDHIRPRVRVPESWHWPVGVSVSTEIGYQRRQFSPDTWTQEIRPIIDKQLGKWYFAFNPSLELSYHGESAGKAPGFSPNFTVGYDVTKKINVALEYYGSLGPITGFDPLQQQEQQIFPAINLNLDPKWEVNMGVGWGLTAGTDHLIGKFILGRRFDF